MQPRQVSLTVGLVYGAPDILMLVLQALSLTPYHRHRLAIKLSRLGHAANSLGDCCRAAQDPDGRDPATAAAAAADDDDDDDDIATASTMTARCFYKISLPKSD